MVVDVDLKTRPLEEWPLEQTIQQAVVQALFSVSGTEWDLGADVARSCLQRATQRVPQFVARAPMQVAVRLLPFVGMYRPEWAPVLVVQEAQALGVEGVEQLLTAVYGHKAGRSQLHVIVETSDALWAQQQKRLVKALESYTPFQVQEAKEEDARRQLVPRVWTEEEFEKVWAAFGGHGGSLRVVNDRAQTFGLDEAIKSHSAYVYGVVEARLSDAGMDLVEPFLAELQAANFSLTVKEPMENQAVRALLTRNLLMLSTPTWSCRRAWPSAEPSGACSALDGT